MPGRRGAGGHETIAIRCEANGVNPPGMGHQGNQDILGGSGGRQLGIDQIANHLSIGNRPELDHAIAAGACQLFAVWTDRDRKDALAMPLFKLFWFVRFEFANQFAGIRFP